MAVAFNNGETRYSNPGTTISWAYSCSAGSNRLLLSQTSGNGVTVNSGTYAAAALTNAGSTNVLTMWRKIAPTTGSNTLSFTLSSYSRCHASTSDWTGVDQTTPLGTKVGNTATNASPSTGSITCPGDGAIFGSVFSGYCTAIPTAGAGTTLVGSEREGAGGSCKAGGRRSSTGAISFALTPSQFHTIQAFPIKPVSFPRNGDMNFMGI